MKGPGRPPIKHNEEHAKQVQALSQYGVPQEDIAATIGVCVETLVKLYRAEMDMGRAIANARIGKSLFEKAVAGDTTAAIFWAKTQMGWRESQRMEVDATVSANVTSAPMSPREAALAGIRAAERDED